VIRLVKGGELDRDLDDPPVYGPRPPRPRRLDPFTEIVRERLTDYPELSSVRLLEEVQAAGYTGGYSQLRDYVRSVRPRPAPEPPNRSETPPGRQGQIDFAEFRFPWGKRYALVVVLGHSRLKYFRYFQRQDMRSLFRGLEEAFHFFGGLPEGLLFDQMKAVITKDLRLLGGQLVVNQEFLRFAAHWDFTPRACRPTAPARRARWSVPSVTSATTSSTGAHPGMTPTWTSSAGAGSTGQLEGPPDYW
jgi:transposase